MPWRRSPLGMPPPGRLRQLSGRPRENGSPCSGALDCPRSVRHARASPCWRAPRANAAAQSARAGRGRCLSAATPARAVRMRGPRHTAAARWSGRTGRPARAGGGRQPVNQTVATGMLARLVDGGRGGRREQALAMAAAGGYALIMDCQLPGMDGYGGAPHSRRRTGDACPLSRSAHARDDERDRCPAVGMDDLLTKLLSLRRCARVRSLAAAGEQRAGRWREH